MQRTTALGESESHEDLAGDNASEPVGKDGIPKRD